MLKLKILDHQTKNIGSAAFILAIFSLFSALLGLLRDRLLAQKFGAGNELDIYYSAFKIPDFINTVMIMGAIAAAITPIFSYYLVHSREKAFSFLSNLFNLFLLFSIIICFILIIFIPFIFPLITPGFSIEKREMAMPLVRIMLLSPIFLGLSNIFSSILRVFQRFLIASLAPLMYNLGIIFGILFFVPLIGLTGLAWAVVFGGILHFLIQLPSLLKIGFRFKKIFDIKEPGFLKTIKLTIPRSLGLAATQINSIVVMAIISTLSSGSIAIFNLADNLSRPLLTFIAFSISTAAFPSLCLAFSQKNKEKFNQLFFSSFFKIFFLLLFFCFLVFIFREFIIKLILFTGKFNIENVHLTAACLGILMLGIFSDGLSNLIIKTFYSFHDTKTSSIISIIIVIINILLCFWFVKLFSFVNPISQFFSNFLNLQKLENIKIIALPLALSFSAVLQLILLLIFFWQKKKKIFQG